MSICPWCGTEYEVPAMYHVCPDGTNLGERLRKSSEDIAKERERQDRLRSGYKAMKESIVPSSEAIVSSKEPKLPEQPNTPTGDFRWNNDDLKLAKKARFKL